MAAPLKFVLTALLAWSFAAPLLWWARLPGPWRHTLALLTSAASLVFLLAAIGTEGVRESPTTVVFLVGPSYVIEQASASASLPYYVMTGVCLLLGTVGLAVGDEMVARLRRRFITLAIGMGLAVTALRFCLDKMAAPPLLTAVIGVVWLPPLVGAFFAQNFREQGKGLGSVAGALLLYGFVVRGSILLLMLLASTYRLGSHYDVSGLVRVQNTFTHEIYRFEPGSLTQVLVLGVIPQLVVWPIYTVVLGLLGAGVVWLANWGPPRDSTVRADVQMAAADGEH
jgi:hypothetical protein